VVGYSSILSIAAALKKAGAVDTDKLVAAFRGLEIDTPLGHIVYRPQDNQSTMGTYVGRTAVKDGKGIMTNFTYVDGASVQPSDAEVKKLRAPE
jgi:branched-chain amino acid transport system substrate-binding protein